MRPSDLSYLLSKLIPYSLSFADAPNADLGRNDNYANMSEPKDDAPSASKVAHSIIPGPLPVKDDEYALVRQVRQLQRALTGTRVVYLELEITPEHIFLLEKRIIERVPLG